MKTKKEAVKKTKIVSKKKTSAKVRTISSVKKAAKKTKVAPVSKRPVRKTKTVASSKALHVKTLTDDPLFALSRKTKYRLKRLTYMILAVALGMLSAGIVLGFMEKIYLESSFRSGIIPYGYQFLGMHVFLLPIVYLLIFSSGICFGAWLGFWGWRAVYIEKRHRMFRK